MEAAKRLFPDRNGSQNRDQSMMGWSVWKFHYILHKAMELLLYGWSENVSTQRGESAHKILFHIIPHNCTYAFLTWWCKMAKLYGEGPTSRTYSGALIKKRNCCVWSDNTEGDNWLKDWKKLHYRNCCWRWWYCPLCPSKAGMWVYVVWFRNQLPSVAGSCSSWSSSHKTEGST